MADISMCQNTECKKKDKCYRQTAIVNRFWQSYIQPDGNKNGKGCTFFWKIRRI